ncbi:helix-turn-helix transcriptional regulator [Leucobacter luti]|uniref:helix-turn-helix transcriptional regulator n=1 Tax=Leucobacter luti TaxID=340320 RepID=UPI003CFDF812
MHKTVIAPDRVLLLLSLVAFLREQESPVSVASLAERFDASPALIRNLVSFLGTAGVPGETMSYQHEDLFDIDWELLEREDAVWLTQTVAVDEAPRFAPAETAALLAGLHALTPVLPAEHAELARATAAKLAGALGVGEQPALTVTADTADPRIPAIVEAIEAGRRLAFSYRDTAGRASSRRVAPIALSQGQGAWYLRAYCLDREAERTFRVDQMSDPRVLPGDAPGRASNPDPERLGGADPARPGATRGVDPVPALVARVSARALPRLRGFAPEVVEEAAEGAFRVRVAAWHEGAAVQLVQAAPGEVVIEEPAAAREAVREWAERGLAAYGE